MYYILDFVVKFIINVLDSLFKMYFKDVFLGLKSVLDNENIKFLDFVIGIGIFLLEVFRKVLEMRKISDGGIFIKRINIKIF